MDTAPFLLPTMTVSALSVCAITLIPGHTLLTGISCISGLTLSLNGFAYSVGESDGSVNICVLGLGGTGSSTATATISTQDISAISLYTLQ